MAKRDLHGLEVRAGHDDQSLRVLHYNVPCMPFRSWAPIPVLFCAAIVNAQGLPEDPGKATVESTCGRCHGVSTAVQARETRKSWDLIIANMIARGATGTDEDFGAIVTYLMKYFGKVNINTGTAKEIEDVAGLSASEAKAIVEYRSQNGEIKTMDDLKKVPNLDTKKLDDLSGRIAFR
jgi:competence protein ComEA